MKKKAVFIAQLSFFFLFVSLSVHGHSIDWSSKPLQSERSRSYDALHYLVKIRLDLERKAFEGATTDVASSLQECSRLAFSMTKSSS